VNLHQDFDPRRVRFLSQSGDEGKRLGDHEATSSSLLDRVTSRVEPDDVDSRTLKLGEDLS